MRPINKGDHPRDEQNTTLVFNHYTEATPYLKQRLGRYCNYCERMIAVSLAVEHVVPKSIEPRATLDWANFLLACANCNSSKQAKNIQHMDCLRPDVDDTYTALSYNESGAIKPNLNCSPDVQLKALRLLTLVGLDKYPSTNDHRWDDRVQAWGRATQAQALLKKKRDAKMLDYLIASAQAGAWSIWMTVFKDDAQVRQRLVQAFPGTRWNQA
jgi:uncharacterized protein (TIGR02646 family)